MMEGRNTINKEVWLKKKLENDDEIIRVVNCLWYKHILRGNLEVSRSTSKAYTIPD